MTPPLVCVTITAPSMAELRARRDLATDADLVELRLDSVCDPDVAAALQDRRRPVIVTCRAAWEGGAFKGSEEERHRLLEEALLLGAEYVDVEWRAGFSDLLVSTRGRRIVLSSHDFDGVPSDLAARAQAMRASGAEVVKIAVKANRLADCVALLELAAVLGPMQRKVLIGMGDAGMVTRILAARFGSAWTYAGALGDLGQVTLRQLLEMYRFRGVSERTALYGLTGSPIAHSVSPAMHNAALKAAGLDAVYVPLPAVDAADFVALARALGLKGASVTIPFKRALAEMLDESGEIDAIGTEVGAINTIRLDDGRWLGTNTDVAGFLRPLTERGVPLKNRRASILGAGGSARAVAVGLRASGASIAVHARNADRARELAALAEGSAGPWPPEPGSWDLLVNCTPVGMHPHVHDTPLPAASLARDGYGGRLVYDLVYNPQATRLLTDATAAGCQTIGGLDMLVAQAQEQFRWWTGLMPESGTMRQAALERLSEFATHENHLV